MWQQRATGRAGRRRRGAADHRHQVRPAGSGPARTRQDHDGFDVEVAKYIANYLGVPESGITWREAPSAQRENLIKNGEVDFVVGTYSITDNRKKVIDFAGPYYVAGQSLLVRADDDSITGAESLQGGKKLCSVSGSTPAQKIAKSYPGVQLQQFDSYSSCVEALHRGKVDALTTDDIILAGYAAQYPGEFKLAGQPFTTELYGVACRRARPRRA